MNRSFTALAGLTVIAVGIGIAVVVTQGSGPDRAGATTTATAVPDTVSVSGTGTVEGVPDTLIANLRVHTTQPTVQEALNVSATDAREVIGSLHDHGVAPVDIRTTNISLNQSYDEHGVPNGYDSGESLTVHITPLSKVGQVLTAAAKSAGNSVSIDGLSFDIADNSTLLADARQSAFDNAKAAAAQYAKLGGTSLSHVVSIRAIVHNASPIPEPYYRKDTLSGLASSAGTNGVPVRAGQKKVSVTVKVVWGLT